MLYSNLYFEEQNGMRNFDRVTSWCDIIVWHLRVSYHHGVTLYVTSYGDMMIRVPYIQIIIVFWMSPLSKTCSILFHSVLLHCANQNKPNAVIQANKNRQQLHYQLFLRGRLSNTRPSLIVLQLLWVMPLRLLQKKRNKGSSSMW